MSLYQRDDGKWAYSPTGLASDEKVLDTRREVGIIMAKIDLANKAKNLATVMAQLARDLDEVKAVYFDRGYNSGGANEMVDSDVEATGNTAAEIGAIITLAEQFATWYPGGFTEPADESLAVVDHETAVNKLRTDL
jgi:hypothetical protein